MLTIKQAITEEELTAAANLMREYTEWGFQFAPEESADAPTFENLEEELNTLPGVYAPPTGRLLIAMMDDKIAGCVCLKGHDENVCELKRFYVKPEFRGQKIGYKLVDTLIAMARAENYQRIVLDSHKDMKAAHHIYEKSGFDFIPIPDDFPEHLKPKVVFMAMEL